MIKVLLFICVLTWVVFCFDTLTTIVNIINHCFEDVHIV